MGLKIAVLISGRGSNLQSIIDACAHTNFPATVEVVISNKPDVMGLKRAQQAGLKTHTVDHTIFETRKEFEHALIETLACYEIDLVCLAGFMRVLTPYFIAQWSDRLINIHPSLLPQHKGLNTHERAIEAGDTHSGCTVHYVVPDIDSGKIIVQKAVPILENDTADTLAQRVLEQEHIAYPEAIKVIAQQLS